MLFSLHEMDALLMALAIATPAAYAIAAGTYLARFRRGRVVPRAILAASLALAVVCHAAWLSVASAILGICPLARLYDATSTVTLAVVLVYLSIELRIGQTTTGFFVLAFAFALTLATALVGSRDASTSADLTWPVSGLHVFAAIVGVAASATAAIYGFLWLALYGQLRSHRFGAYYNRLPPLEVLERITERAVTTAFGALSISLPLGLVELANRAHGATWLWDGKILAAAVTWSVFSLLVAGRRWGGTSGKRLAQGALVAFALVLVSLVVVNIHFTEFHGFG